MNIKYPYSKKFLKAALAAALVALQQQHLFNLNKQVQQRLRNLLLVLMGM